MKSFKAYITEDQNLNTHMDHIEDLVFLRGIEGTKEALDFLRELRNMLTGKGDQSSFVNMKVDGSPAIIAGPDPETGDFFVGTKSVFNRNNPKRNYSERDIDENHSGDLADKLKIAFNELPKLKMRTILQGDLMFTPDIIKRKKIDGEAHLVFQPNTIAYAVPENSDLAKKLKQAKLGIVFHTEYTGNSWEDLKANFLRKLPRLNSTSDVWVQDSSIADATGTVQLDKRESAEVDKILSDIGKTFNKLDRRFVDEIKNDKKVMQMILTHINSVVKEGVGDLKPKAHAESLIGFIDWKFKEEAKKRSTEKGKKKQQQNADEMIEWLRNNQDQFETAIKLLNLIREAKTIMLRKLEHIESFGKTFIKDEDGYKVTAPEGFVAVSAHTGKAVKLVDRLEFSKQNFVNSLKKYGK